MESAQILIEKRAGVIKSANELVTKAKEENRELTDAEMSQFEDYEKQAKELGEKIERAKRFEAMEAAAAKQVKPTASPKPKTAEDRAIERFDMAAAIKSKLDGGSLPQAAQDMVKEAEKEALAAGISDFSGKGVALPSWAVKAMSRKNREAMRTKAGEHTVGTAASLGNLVNTDDVRQYAALAPSPFLADMGAQMWTGLVGNVPIVQDSNFFEAEWASEIATSTKKTATTTKVTLTPNRLTAYSDISRQLLRQTAGVANRMLTTKLENAIARSLDKAALQGNGGTIDGLLGLSGVSALVIGANGGAITHDQFVEMENKIAESNGSDQNLAYITTNAVRKQTKLVKIDAGSGKFLFNDMTKEVNGYPLIATNLMPSNLTKGTGTNLSACIFGDWTKLIIAQWGGVDIIVDELTGSKEALVNIVVHSWYDVNTEQPAHFVHYKDMDPAA